MHSMLKQCAACAAILAALLVVSLPTHASPPIVSAVICQNNASDADGDGWGWENSTQCVVTDAVGPRTARPICRTGTTDPDLDGWEIQSGVSCLVIKTRNSNQPSIEAPTSASTPDTPEPPIAYASCKLASSDPDRDGWGFENGKSCVVDDTSSTAVSNPTQDTTQPTTDNSVVIRNGRERRVCEFASSDADGDGWGLENNTSCVVTENSAASSDTVSEVVVNVVENNSNRNICSSSLSDDDGDGFGYEGGRSCDITSRSKPFPICVSTNSYPDNGFGYESGKSCIIVDGVSLDVPSPEANTRSANTNDAVVSNPVQNRSAAAFTPAVFNGKNVCASTLSDDDNDGYGYEGGRSCVVTSLTRPYPICLSIHSDRVGDGFGYENGKSCITVEGISGTRDNLLLGTELCDSWIEIAYGNYRIENNTWNSTVMDSNRWSQCIELNLKNNRPVASWTFDWLSEEEGQVGAVKSYPQVYYGRKTELSTSGTYEQLGLPEYVYNLPEFKVDYEWSASGNSEYNVALESFFHYNCRAEHANKAFEMMVWVGIPEDKKPGVFVTNAKIDGKNWRVYANPNLGWGYVAFALEESSNSGTLNWNRFVEWSRDNSRTYGLGDLRSADCMGAIEIGTETFWGKGKFTLDRFNVRID